MFKIRNLLLLFFVLTSSLYSQASQVTLKAESLSLDCKKLSYRLPRDVALVCNLGIKVLKTQHDITIEGPLLTTDRLAIEAKSIQILENSSIYAPSFHLSADAGISIAGEIVTTEMQISSKSNVELQGKLSSKNGLEILAPRITIYGKVSGPNGVTFRGQEISLDDKSEINSVRGSIELLGKKSIQINSSLLLGNAVRAYSDEFKCETSKVLTQEQLIIHNLGKNESLEQGISLDSCTLHRGVQFPSIFSRNIYYSNNFWGISKKSINNNINKNFLISLGSTGDIIVKDSQITTPKNTSIFRGNKIVINGEHIGSGAPFTSPEIEIHGGWVELGSSVLGKTINLVQNYKEGTLLNNGILLAKNGANSYAEGSFANRGAIYSKGIVYFTQKSTQGKCINAGSILGKEIYSTCNGEIDFSKGSRIALDKTVEQFPNGISASKIGKINTSKLYHYSPLTSELVDAYVNKVKFTNAAENQISFFDTDPSLEKTLELKKKIVLDAGLHIESPNLKVLQDVAFDVNNLNLTATIGDLEILHSTSLKSKNQVTLVGARQITRISKLEEIPSGEDAKILRSEVHAGDGGIQIHTNNYTELAAITSTPGTLVLDVSQGLSIVPLVHQFEKTKLVKHDVFGKKTKTYGHTKFFNSEWNVGKEQWLSNTEKVKIVNLRKNNKNYKPSGSALSKVNEENIELEHHEDVSYSYTTYSPSLATHIVRGALRAVGAAYGGAVGLAIADSVTEPLSTGESLTLENAIENFAINIAASSIANQYGSAAANVTRGALSAGLKDQDYSFEQLISGVLKGELSDKYLSSELAHVATIQKKFIENLAYKAIDGIVYKESLDLEEFAEDLVVKTLNSTAETIAYNFTSDLIAEYKNQTQIDKVEIKKTTTSDLELIDSLNEEEKQDILEAFFSNQTEIQDKAAKLAFGKSFSELSREQIQSHKFLMSFHIAASNYLPKGLTAAAPLLIPVGLTLIEGGAAASSAASIASSVGATLVLLDSIYRHLYNNTPYNPPVMIDKAPLPLPASDDEEGWSRYHRAKNGTEIDIAAYRVYHYDRWLEDSIQSSTNGQHFRPHPKGSNKPTLKDSSSSFIRTHSIRGKASSRNVKNIVKSMKNTGWVGPPIDVILIGKDKYILNGHHRVAAAKIAKTDVPYNLISEQDLGNFGYSSTSEVVKSASETRTDKIRIR